MRKRKIVYVSDELPGYRRKKWGRGFVYLYPDGIKIKDKDLKFRFENLVIPPAWNEVWICVDENGHIQATGRDDAGRKQYIYHPDWEEQRAEYKYSEMIKFGKSLPDIRKKIDADLRKHNFYREKVIALALMLLDEALIRIGNKTYTEKYGSFGLTTFRQKHIEVHGSKIKFEFTGKKGVEREVELKDKRLSRIIQNLQELPGQHLFVYYDENGEKKKLSSSDVNDYLHEITGKEFTSKNFRTWGGSVLALQGLLTTGKPKNKKEAKKKIVEVVKEIANELGNTPAVCREYYIHPEILQAYEDGSLFEEKTNSRKSKYMEPAEKALLKFLIKRNQ